MQYSQLNCRLYSDFTIFSTDVFCLLQDPIQAPFAFAYHVSLVSSGLWQFLSLFKSFMTPTHLKKSAHYCRIFIALDLCDSFSLLDWGYALLRRMPQKQLHLVSRGIWSQNILLPVMLTLVTWVWCHLLGLLIVSLLFLPFVIKYLGGGALCK